MVVKHKIKMDLALPAMMPKIDVVQRDQFTREIELSLYSNGMAWEIPEDISVIVYFLRADGTGGDYDTLSNGEQAWSAAGNVLTVEIAPPVMAKAGPVAMALDLIRGENRVSTFTFLLDVQKSLCESYTPSEDGLSVTAFIPMPKTAEVGQYFQVSKVDEKGRILQVEAVAVPGSQASIEEALAEAKKYFVCGEVVAQTVGVTRAFTADGGITVNFGGNRLQGVKTPQLDTDAVNKAYVDQAVGGSVVPDYWQEAVDAACEKVTALQDAGGRSAVSFVWFSDSHVNQDEAVPNPGHTGALAAAVMDKCRIPFAVMSGDAARSDGNGLASEAQIRGSLAAAEKIFAPIGGDRLLQVQGNHDGSWGYKEGLADPYFCYQMDGKELYGAIFRPQAEDQRRVFGGDGSCFYVDHPASKTRFVLLNSNWVEDLEDENGVAQRRRMRTFGYGNQQLNWLAGEALKFHEDGWAVVLAAHVPPVADYDATCRDEAVLRGILTAFAEGTSYSGNYGTDGAWDYVSVSCDYSTGYRAQIIGFFAGHAHKDSLDVSTYAYPVITITSDADLSYDENEQARVMGTDNEHALDIVTIDREHNLVTMTRLGVGSDRSYSLEAQEADSNLADAGSSEWVNNSRLNSSAEVVEYSGSCVTNWIPCNSGDVIRISGLNILDSTCGYMAFENIYLEAMDCAKCPSYADHFTKTDDVISYTIFTINQEVSDAWQGRIRFSGALTAASAKDVVITVNQEI